MLIYSCTAHPATEGLATFLSVLLRYVRDDANQHEGKGGMN